MTLPIRQEQMNDLEYANVLKDYCEHLLRTRKQVDVKHHENGDSEFTLPVTVHVGCSDRQESSVTIGGLVRYTIYFSKLDNAWGIVDRNDDTVKDMLESKDACVKWLLEALKGINND